MEISDRKLRDIYETADPVTRKKLDSLFPYYERIKSLDDALSSLGENHSSVINYRALEGIKDKIHPRMLAFAKLQVIADALNGGWKPSIFHEDSTVISGLGAAVGMQLCLVGPNSKSRPLDAHQFPYLDAYTIISSRTQELKGNKDPHYYTVYAKIIPPEFINGGLVRRWKLDDLDTTKEFFVPGIYFKDLSVAKYAAEKFIDLFMEFLFGHLSDYMEGRGNWETITQKPTKNEQRAKAIQHGPRHKSK